MKKKKSILLSMAIFILALGCNNVLANDSYKLSDAINLYKNGNYTECYYQLNNILKNDPANILAYYYMGMTSAQIGKRDEAIENYNKVLTLSTQNNNLYKNAKKGKICIETPDKCKNALYEGSFDAFVRSNKNELFSEEVKEQHEKLKLENLKNDMNRFDNIEKSRFKEFEDFSAAPTNDEIVAALRVLQKAGLTGIANTNNYADLSILTGNSQNNSMYNMFGASGMSPQLIQSLLTNGITQGF